MTVFRVVQLNFSPEIQVFYMRFERALSIFSTSLKQHITVLYCIYITSISGVKSSWTSLYILYISTDYTTAHGPEP